MKLTRLYADDDVSGGGWLAWWRRVGRRAGRFFEKNYGAFLVGVLLAVATVFAILGFQQKKGRLVFEAGESDVLGEKAGSVSAVATVSAQTVETLTPTPLKATAVAKAKTEAKVNLNTATAEEIVAARLPGIGPVLSQRIVAYRAAHGPFRRVDDLVLVSGIGEKKLAQIRGLVMVEE